MVDYNIKSNESEDSDELDKLRKELENTKRENMELHKTLQEYGIEEISQITDVEFICNTQIERLRTSAQNGELYKDQVENLERIVKILNREWAGVKKKELKTHEKDVGKLIKIATSNE